MKVLNLFLLMVGIVFAPIASAIEGLNLGVAVTTVRTDDEKDVKVDGLFFADFEGFEKDFGDDKTINFVPTSVEIEMDGKKVKAYTDIATLQLYGMENIEVAITAFSAKYEKRDDFFLRKEEKVSVVDVSATKFIPLGSMDLDITAAVSAGGYIKSQFKIANEYQNIRERHNYTVDIGAGINAPITDTIDLYFYGGGFQQNGETTQTTGVYAGVEVYGIEIAKDVVLTPHLDFVQKKVDAGSLFDSVESSAILMGVRIDF